MCSLIDTVTGLLKVAVTMMLQHRIIDEPKRKGSWVAKLQQTAQYAIETTPPEQFSSSKGSGFSERMRDRALNEIMPSLFSIAQIYEDHLARNNLYEGTGNVDTGEGTMCTWQPVSRPPRQSTFTRKRAKVQSRVPRRRAVSEDTVSDDETEVDDTVTESFLRRQGYSSRKQQRMSKADGPQPMIASTAAPTVSATPMPPYVAAPPSQGSTMVASPNASFDGTMTRLRLDDDADDVDVKYVNSSKFNNANVMCNMYALSQPPMHYSTPQPCFSTPGFHGSEHAVPFNSPNQSPFVAGSTYTHYPMFNMAYPPLLDNTGFATSTMSANHDGYPYDFDGGFNVAANGVDVAGPFTGLGADAASHKPQYSFTQ